MLSARVSVACMMRLMLRHVRVLEAVDWVLPVSFQRLGDRFRPTCLEGPPMKVSSNACVIFKAICSHHQSKLDRDSCSAEGIRIARESRCS